MLYEVITITNSKYYTCHCTGIEAFEYLQNMMDDSISYISTGSEIKLQKNHSEIAMDLFKQGYNCCQA